MKTSCFIIMFIFCAAMLSNAAGIESMSTKLGPGGEVLSRTLYVKLADGKVTTIHVKATKPFQFGEMKLFEGTFESESGKDLPQCTELLRILKTKFKWPLKGDAALFMTEVIVGKGQKLSSRSCAIPNIEAAKAMLHCFECKTKEVKGSVQISSDLSTQRLDLKGTGCGCK